MQVVGITGGIGSGKSVVSRFLRAMGYAVYDSDAEAKRIMDGDEALKKQLSEIFGADIYAVGRLDRRALAGKVFSDASALARLNAAVHPAVRADFRRWAEAHGDAPILFMESAILAESGFTDMVDAVWLVEAPEEIRVARIVRRDSCSAQEARQRIRAQWSDEAKERYASVVLHNDGKKPLIPQILGALQNRFI